MPPIDAVLTQLRTTPSDWIDDEDTLYEDMIETNPAIVVRLPSALPQ